MADTSSDEPIIILDDLKKHPVTQACVYQDRAEVTRAITASSTQGAGTYCLQLMGLVEAADTSSIRVKTGAGPTCEILEVSFGVNYRSADKDVSLSEKEAEARAVLKAAEDCQAAKVAEKARVAQRDVLVQSYMGAMLGAKPAKDGQVSAPAAGADLATITALLNFHEAQGADTDARARALEVECVEAAKNVAHAKKALQLLSAASGSGPRASRDVSIIFTTASAEPVVLLLTYNVQGASWTPSYDLRVSSADEKGVSVGSAEAASECGGGGGCGAEGKGDAKRKPREAQGGAQGGDQGALQLTYFGVVRQSSGEDWTGCRLSLSTV
jgi:hypothetical protein